MPLARIDLVIGKSDEYRTTIGSVVYDAMISTLNVPPNDRFQVISEHALANFIADKTYAGIERTDDVVMIQLTLNEGRTVEVKKAFYLAVAEGLHTRLGLRKEDVFMNLVEVKKENWSFGDGIAQYA